MSSRKNGCHARDDCLDRVVDQWCHDEVEEDIDKVAKENGTVQVQTRHEAETPVRYGLGFEVLRLRRCEDEAGSVE